MADNFEHSVRAVVLECIERCGENFTIPVELISSEPATLGTITFTVRINKIPEAEDYVNHCMSHLVDVGEL